MNFLTKTRFLVIVIIIQTVLLISILGTFGYRYYSSKQYRNEPRKTEGKQPNDFIAKSLQLTPEQREEFRMLKVKFHQSFDTLETQSRIISKKLTEEIIKDTPDSVVIDSLITRFGEIQKLQKRAMVEHLIEVKSNCDPEQCQRFNKFMLRMNDYQQKQHRNMERMRRGQNPRNINKNNQN